MMREQGQQMPQPQAFGEEILNGDFRLGGGEVTQELRGHSLGAVLPRPSPHQK